MKIISIGDPDSGLVHGYRHLRESGVRQSSRGGNVLVAPTPVITEWLVPQNRVSLDVVRDANPFFHLYEAFWMLSGSRDGKELDHFVKDFSERYGESDGTIHGAYGWRWRNHFEIEQVTAVIHRLNEDPDSRQAVISMWDPDQDFFGQWKDRPCNTHIYFRRRGNYLDMTVCCRSNDIYWGCYGANAVHFSILQEYIAVQLGCNIGVYYQFSNNFHIYESMEEKALKCELRRSFPTITPLFVKDERRLDFDLQCIRHREWGRLKCLFLKTYVAPMMEAFDLRKSDPDGALALLTPKLSDWHEAGYNWIRRRMK